MINFKNKRKEKVSKIRNFTSYINCKKKKVFITNKLSNRMRTTRLNSKSKNSTSNKTEKKNQFCLKYFFQCQCFFQRCSAMSSIGTPLVSGRKKIANSPMITFMTAKKKNKPDLNRHSADKKNCPITKVHTMFIATAQK